MKDKEDSEAECRCPFPYNKGQNSLENTEQNFSLFLGIEHKIYSRESGYFR